MKLAHLLVCYKTDPARLFASIPASPDARWYVFLHSDSESIRRLAEEEIEKRSGYLFDYRINRGLSKSWNDGISAALKDDCESILLLNDDLFFFDGGYQQFCNEIKHLRDRRDISYITVNGLEAGESQQCGETIPQNFACCAISATTIEKVGYFDENLTPAYFEDIDYDRRAFFSNLRPYCVPDALVKHDRSSTMHLSTPDEKLIITKAFRSNQAYFERKWGLKHELERPFGNQCFDSFISFENRATPYGQPFDRVEDSEAMRVTLEDIGFAEGTDKSKLEHDFLGFYEKELCSYKGKRFLLIEIGVSQGSSIRTWSRFFDEAIVVGLDIEPSAVDKVNRSNAHVRIGDASRLETVDNVVNEFGLPLIVIDDGSHQWHHMIETLRYLWPRVRPGGAYVMEDLHTSFPDLKEAFRGHSEISPYEYLMEINRWVVGNRYMSGIRASDGFVANYWPTIESIHFHRGTCILYKKGEQSDVGQR